MITDSQVSYRLPSDPNTEVRVEIIRETTEASIDQCCQRFVDGDDSMMNACDSSQVEATTIVYDPLNMCRSRTETITEFTFPIAMTQAKTETDV